MEGHLVRCEADDIVDQYEDADLSALADELERKADVCDQGGEMAFAVAAELRRRAAAGIRHWPGPSAAA